MANKVSLTNGLEIYDDEVNVTDQMLNDNFTAIDGSFGMSRNAGDNPVVFDQHDNGNSGSAATIDFAAYSNKQKITLTDNCTFTFTPPTDATNLLLMIVQDGTGSRTVTWPGTVLWSNGVAVTLSTAASAVDIITMYFDGTNYHAVSSLNFQ